MTGGGWETEIASSFDKLRTRNDNVNNGVEIYTMSIIRISKTKNMKDYFQDRLAGGLIDLQYEKWVWKYMENPFFLGDDLPVWLCDLEGKAAGYLGTIPVKLKAGPRKINAAWAVDFKVLSEYRKKGQGMLLVREANQYFDAFLAIGGTDMSSNLFTKMGWVCLGKVPYYIKVWDAGMPMNLFFRIYNCLKKPIQPKGIEARRMGDFEDEADIFWKEIEDFYKIAVPRDKAYLNWKYDKQPGLDYVKFRAVRDNKLCGYIVTRVVKSGHSKTDGLIVDIIVRPDDKDAIRALVFAALEYLKSEDCSMARFCINNKEIERVIASCGFIRRRPRMRFFVKKNIEGLEEIYDMNSWHITAGDSDTDR